MIKLEVYQKAVEFTSQAYKLTRAFPQDELYGLTSQFRRAAVSVALNIAEGSGRSKREYLHFLVVARTSVFECIPILQIAWQQGYISKEQRLDQYSRCESLAQMLSATIRALKKCP